MSGKECSIVEFKREPDNNIVDILDDALELAKSGQLTELVIVGNLPRDNGFLTRYSCMDRWRLLGALEYAKHQVGKND